MLQRIRMAFSRLPHFKEVRMTDDQINILLARASRKMRRGMFDRKSVVLADGNTQLTDGDFRYAVIGEKGAANFDNADSDIEPEISQAISKYKSFQAKEILKNIAGKPLNNIETGIDAQINTNQYNKMTSNAAVNKSLRNGFSRDKHFEALANIENLFKNAVLLEQTDDLKNNDNNVKIYRFASPFVIDNQIADVMLTVKRSIDNDTKRIYSLELIEIKKLSEKGSTTTNAQYYTDSILKLQQKHEKIKSFLENNANKLRFGVPDKSDVSDELRFSIADYSLDEQSDIIDILTPYIGTVVDKTPAEIAAFYGQVAYKVIYPFLSVTVRIGPSYQNRMI